MQRNSVKRLGILIVTCFLFLGCYKNYTNYYPDGEDVGLTIFSNTGNNIMSCFIDGRPWRTIDRVQGGFSYVRTIYEVDIIRQRTNSLMDTLFINWLGHYNNQEIPQGTVGLVLAIPKDFSYRDFSALQEQRLSIDTTRNGFFYTGISGLSVGNPKGNGSIYFQKVQLDSISPNRYSGSMSGLFEAGFPLFKITKGRFDELLTEENIDL